MHRHRGGQGEKEERQHIISHQAQLAGSVAHLLPFSPPSPPSPCSPASPGPPEPALCGVTRSGVTKPSGTWPLVYCLEIST